MAWEFPFLSFELNKVFKNYILLSICMYLQREGGCSVCVVFHTTQINVLLKLKDARISNFDNYLAITLGILQF